MTFFTSCIRSRKCTRTLGLAAAACALTSVLAASPLAIPASQWGQGAVDVSSDFGYCESGFGLAQIGPTCTFSGSSVGSELPGTVYGTATAYTDVSGMHSSVDLGSSGFETATDEAESGFTDTITNNSHVAGIFQIGFHVDATLTASGSGALSFLEIQAWDGLPESAFQGIGGGGPNPGDGATQSWGYSGNTGVDLDALTNAVTLAPGASYTYSLTLDADAQTYQLPGTLPVGGPPTASVDALNTLTITSFSAHDTSGNALPASDFGSADGANYAALATSAAAPEPATFGLCGAFLVLLGWWSRRRIRRTSPA